MILRKLLPFLFLLVSVVTARAQFWFDLGANGAWGPTLMLDQNVFDDSNYKHKASFGTAFGARLGINYGYHVGLGLEYTFGSSNQDFNYNGTDSYNSFNWKHNDVAALFRYSGNGAFVELGGKFSSMREVTLESEGNDLGGDVTDLFNKNNISGIFGFGSYLLGNDALTLNLGIRVHYGFKDIITADGRQQPNNLPFVVEPVKDLTKKTLATAAQLRLELNYAFGRFSKKACHERWKLILFQ